jgi:hypothetical protein
MAIPRNLNTTARYTFSNGSQTTIQSQSYYRLSNSVRELEDRFRNLCSDRKERFDPNRIEWGVKVAGDLAGSGTGVVRYPAARE